jgi:hypothetical protein
VFANIPVVEFFEGAYPRQMKKDLNAHHLCRREPARFNPGFATGQQMAIPSWKKKRQKPHPKNKKFP